MPILIPRDLLSPLPLFDARLAVPALGQADAVLDELGAQARHAGNDGRHAHHQLDNGLEDGDEGRDDARFQQRRVALPDDEVRRGGGDYRGRRGCVGTAPEFLRHVVLSSGGRCGVELGGSVGQRGVLAVAVAHLALGISIVAAGPVVDFFVYVYGSFLAGGGVGLSLSGLDVLVDVIFSVELGIVLVRFPLVHLGHVEVGRPVIHQLHRLGKSLIKEAVHLLGNLTAHGELKERKAFALDVG
ncbi:hypothetical protein PG999_003918 [Apiospora kogelbergensis]|uniref:Uncharacterized protein n=1 Tax=Apiospora kogelbergensis TaxID=1337665 RepID=A0AAW0R511_9PEZI